MVQTARLYGLPTMARVRIVCISDPPDDRPFRLRRVGRSCRKVAPGLHVFGHIHGGHGRVHDSNGCEFVNASVLNEHSMLVSEPEIVDLET